VRIIKVPACARTPAHMKEKTVPYFTWQPDFEIGIDVLDAQHKRIVQYINDLHDAMGRNDDDAIRVILDQVVDYTLTHFIFEAKMMESAGYKHTEAHKEHHRAFAERISSYVVLFNQGEDISQELLSDLLTLLTNHIRNEDRHFAATVQKQRKAERHQNWLSRTLVLMFR
jgi:hemerythrin